MKKYGPTPSSGRLLRWPVVNRQTKQKKAVKTCFTGPLSDSGPHSSELHSRLSRKNSSICAGSGVRNVS